MGIRKATTIAGLVDLATLGIATAALAVILGALSATTAKSDPAESTAPTEEHWTVLTMAPDGSWGTATVITTSRAIAGAIAQCKTMSQAPIGCGAKFTTIRAGWSLGFRCGSENIIAADKTLAGAEQSALRRETELRQLYMPHLPPCARVVTVDPQGRIVAPVAALASAPSAAAQPPVWRTITIGTHKGANGYRDALDAAHMGIGDAADEILGRPAFAYARAAAEFDLVRLSVAQLGFTDEKVSLADVYKRARQMGLALCPGEVAPMLRLAYRDQPLGEFLYVAMAPVATYGGAPTILALANAGTGPLLLGTDGDASFMAPRSWRFVFVAPRLTQQAAQTDPSRVR